MITKDQVKKGDILLLKNGYLFVLCKTPEGHRLLFDGGWMPWYKYNQYLQLFSFHNRIYDAPWDVVKAFRPPKHLRKTYSKISTSFDYHYNIEEIVLKSKEITNNSHFINISLYV